MKPGSRGWRPGNLSGKSKKNKIASANQKVAAAKGKGGTKVLSFPSDLGEHRMILKFYEYDYSSVVAGSAKGGTLNYFSDPYHSLEIRCAYSLSFDLSSISHIEKFHC